MTKSQEPRDQARKCACPYCEEELIVTGSPFCEGCGVTLRYCNECGAVLSGTVVVCPQCGTNIQQDET